MITLAGMQKSQTKVIRVTISVTSKEHFFLHKANIIKGSQLTSTISMTPSIFRKVHCLVYELNVFYTWYTWQENLCFRKNVFRNI